MIVDAGFGSFVPQLDASHAEMAPVGFVHLPLTGGYLMFTEQPIGSANKLVVTKFTDTGVIDANWPSAGKGGTAALPLPSPDVDYTKNEAQARVVLNIDSGVEEIYIFERYYACSTDGCIQYLFASVMNVSGGVIANAAMPMDSFPKYPWTFTAAAGGVSLGGGVIGSVMAGKATGTNVTELVAAHHNPPAVSPPLVLYHFAEISGTAMRVNGLTTPGTGDVTTFGTEANLAVYGSVLFPLECPSSAPIRSVIDSAVDAQSGSDVIVEGRVDCGSDGLFSEIARVSNIGSAGTVSVISASLMEPLTACDGDFSADDCPFAYLIAPRAGLYASATTPSGAFAHINSDAPDVFFTGADVPPSALPIVATSHYGAYYQFPYLTGMTFGLTPLGNVGFGIGRFIVDRIAADNFGN
jgi:hypothetical protein